MAETHRKIYPGIDSLDLISEAYSQAQRERKQGFEGHYRAPAKINRTLLVGARKENGFHPVDTVMHTVSLQDKLSLACLSPDELPQNIPEDQCVYLAQRKDLPCVLTTKWAPSLVPCALSAQDNLVVKALSALAQNFPKNATCGIRAHLYKRIPVAAGLGGGSSDAAAALKGAAQIWGINTQDPAFLEVAATLGRDVPFFLEGGCSYYSGEGERLVTSFDAPHQILVLFKPEEGVSTKQAYQLFDEQGEIPSPDLVESIHQAKSLNEVPKTNNLEPIACSLVPEIKMLQEVARQASGVGPVMLSGSGSASFAFCEQLEHALNLVAALKKMGAWACLASTLNLGVALIDN